jgi:hypothetical protein
MPQQQRPLVFVGAIVAAVILAIIAVLYLAGNGPLDPGRHIKHALLFFVLAAGALAVANFNRPGTQARR